MLVAQGTCPMCGWMMGWGVAGMAVFGFIILLLIVGAVWLLYRIAKGRRWLGGTPEEHVRERYARGEITREEYERTLDDLKRGT